MPNLKIKVGDHPERQADEVFVENVDRSHFNDYGWDTVRFGKIAYEKGKPVVGLFPVFVKIWEMKKFGWIVEE